MKVIIKIKNQKLKVFAFFAIVFVALCSPSCSNFLDVVPDNVFQYQDLFSSQQQAYNALATLYYGIPNENRDYGPWTLGDEYANVVPSQDLVRHWMQGASIMRGNQSATSTLISVWTGGNWGYGCFWMYLRECNKFIQHVDNIPDMPAEGKADWKAQANFLKAYYLFWMVKMYGPILLPGDEVDESLGDNLFLSRCKVEDCFDEILRLIDEAIPYLKGRRDVQFLGQVDQVTAKAIKARVLLYRASPFFNGNSDYYSNFLDHNGEHFFSQTPDQEKWKAAAEAAQEALLACEQYGFRLYRFIGRPYEYDVSDWQSNPGRMQTLYDLRHRMVERWNDEIIWGVIRGTTSSIPDACCIRKPSTYGGPAPANEGRSWLQASYQMMERYYTENGLPLSEDRNVSANTLHNIVLTPSENSPEYAPMRGYIQPGVTTINMYLNREPRFYTDIGITSSYYRSHQVRIRLTNFAGTDGGYTAALHGTDVLCSGISVQKTVHPQSYMTNLQTMMLYPWPHMRMADIYLMKAEALNEYYGPSQEVYDAINAVRLRAGIPTVEESYTNTEWVTDAALNKHLTKEGLREIILHERSNELAFEFAHRFWDMQRWKRSVNEFSRPLYGWNYLGASAEAFFVQKNIQGRKWSITQCLWPIDNTEMIRNAQLIQNPGW